MRDAAIDPNRQSRRAGASRPASDRPKGDLSSATIAAQRLGGALDRPPARSASPGAAPERRWAVPSFVRRVHPIKAVTTVVFSAALVGIVANAVLFQKSRHAGMPSDVPRGASAGASAPAAKVVAAADAGSTGAVSAPADTGPAPAATSSDLDPVAAAPHRLSAKHVGVKPDGGDAIGRLLGAPAAAGDKAAAAKATESKPAEAKADPALLRAQRELKKLGYAIKPDGHMDGGTRQAIKRFVHDHHLKDEAALTPELRHQIADASSAVSKSVAEPSKAK